MASANNRRGSTWGYGLGLLGLVISIGITLWLFAGTADVYVGAGKQSQQTLDQALEQAKATTQAVDQKYSTNPATDLAPAPATAPATGKSPAGNVPRQMPAHDGGLLEEMSK
jgi:uncharacterized iron-regulated membrane protein